MKAPPVQLLAATEAAPAAIAEGDDSTPKLVARAAHVDYHRPPLPFRPGSLGGGRRAAGRGEVEQEQTSDTKSAGDAGKHAIQIGSTTGGRGDVPEHLPYRQHASQSGGSGASTNEPIPKLALGARSGELDERRRRVSARTS